MYLGPSPRHSKHSYFAYGSVQQAHPSEEGRAQYPDNVSSALREQYPAPWQRNR